MYEPRHYGCNTLCELTRIVQDGWHWQRSFLIQTSNILFPISFVQWSIKNVSKAFFHLISSWTKKIEFGYVKFTESIPSEEGVSKEFLEIGRNSKFSKQRVLQKCKFSFSFQSISYNEVISTKQICFSPTFLKSWIYISDNIPSIIETYSATRGGKGIGREKWYSSLFSNYLDYVFKFKDLLGLEKT